jgi:hypothetical protein
MLQRGVLFFAICLALILRFAFGMPLAVALFITFVGWPLVGTLVTIDDDFPGGWSNPDGTRPSPFRTSTFWRQIVVGLALTAAGSAIDEGWLTPSAGRAWLLSSSLTFVFAALLLTRRRRQFAIAAVALACAFVVMLWVKGIR